MQRRTRGLPRSDYQLQPTAACKATGEVVRRVASVPAPLPKRLLPSVLDAIVESMPYVLLAAAVVLNVAAYAIFRTIAHRPHDVIWLVSFGAGLALGAANLFCFTAALKDFNLAVAYPVFSGATISLMVLTAAWLFGERISSTGIAGCVLVIVGIGLLTRS
jgi:multidrug transporter EmrE-like cation transporter